jgi:thymidine kinase
MSLELIIGPMFSGKSSAILSRIKRAQVLGWPTLVLTSSVDNRYSESSEIVTHNLQKTTAVSLTRLMEAKDTDRYREARLIIIDEAQFFPDLREFVLYAVDNYAKTVVVVGLDGDSERRPFGHIGDLLPLADTVEKLNALCTHCNDWTPAIFSHRKTTDNAQIVIGGCSIYEPLCRKHYLSATKAPF